MDQTKFKARETLESIQVERKLCEKLRLDSAVLDKQISSLLSGYVISVSSKDLLIPDFEEETNKKGFTDVASKPSSSKSTPRKTGNNKSSLKQLSVSSMLRRNLTANDDTRQLSLRRESIDDVNFKREDAKVRPSQAITDVKRRRSVKPKAMK